MFDGGLIDEKKFMQDDTEGRIISPGEGFFDAQQYDICAP